MICFWCFALITCLSVVCLSGCFVETCVYFVLLLDLVGLVLCCVVCWYLIV